MDAGIREAFRGLVEGRDPWPLYLWGPTGTGKTSAALALLDHCGPPALPGSWPDDLRDWLCGFVEVRHIPRVRIAADQGRLCWSRDGNAGDMYWDQILTNLRALPLAVFDEIGVGREASDFRLDSLLEVLNVRAEDPVRPFVVTSNLPPSEISRVYDDRVADRVLCGTVYGTGGESRRVTG